MSFDIAWPLCRLIQRSCSGEGRRRARALIRPLRILSPGVHAALQHPFVGRPLISRLSLCAKGGEIPTTILRLFRRDHDNFLAFKDGASRVVGVDQIARRSIFHLLPVQQDLILCQEHQWHYDPVLAEHIRKCQRRLIQTQCIEDAFNRHKNSHHLSNRSGGNNEIFQAVLRHHVAEVHGFTQVDQMQEAHRRGASVPKEAYHGSMRQLPDDVKAMSSYSPIGTPPQPAGSARCTQTSL